jgi:hypothetical protein
MLKKFCVSNFKGFETELLFDLTSANGYTFNASCVKDGVVNNCMVYGYNGCGKSNLALAVFDIIGHLTDMHKDQSKYQNYLNASSSETVASFAYEFLFDGKTVRYEYRKADYTTLTYECFWIGNKEVVKFDRSQGNATFTCSLKGTETLNKEISDRSLSVLKYIKNNSVLTQDADNVIFQRFYTFIENMLFFRSLEDRSYLGQDVDDKKTITAEIIKRGKVKEFEAFLNEANVKCKLAVVETLDGQDLAFDFGKKKLLFTKVMSTGTSVVTLFFYWYLVIQESRVSLVFIDEFDAFYHHELSRLIVRKLQQAGVQFIVTTHNTSLMSNDIMRPDCYYLMGNNKIAPLSRCTEKELREVHNIEKIYKAGGFYVD